jgi:hypothetical protein
MLVTSTRRKKPDGPARSPRGYCRPVSFSSGAGAIRRFFIRHSRPEPSAREVYYADLELSPLFRPLESLSPPAPHPFSRWDRTLGARTPIASSNPESEFTSGPSPKSSDPRDGPAHAISSCTPRQQWPPARFPLSSLFSAGTCPAERFLAGTRQPVTSPSLSTEKTRPFISCSLRGGLVPPAVHAGQIFVRYFAYC